MYWCFILFDNLKLVQLCMSLSQEHILNTADMAICFKTWGILLLHCPLSYAVPFLVTLVSCSSLRTSAKWKCMIFYLLVQDPWQLLWKATNIYLKWSIILSCLVSSFCSHVKYNSKSSRWWVCDKGYSQPSFQLKKSLNKGGMYYSLVLLGMVTLVIDPCPWLSYPVSKEI